MILQRAVRRWQVQQCGETMIVVVDRHRLDSRRLVQERGGSLPRKLVADPGVTAEDGSGYPNGTERVW